MDIGKVEFIISDEAKQWLEELTIQVAAFVRATDKLPKKEDDVTLSVTLNEDDKNSDVYDDGAPDDDDEIELPAKKKPVRHNGASKAKSFDEEDDEVEEEAPAPKAKKKNKAITLEEVNKACMAAARATSRAAVLKVLKKKFAVESVTALEPEQYGAVIAALID